MNRIDRTFGKLKTEKRKAFIPYIMAGDPSLDDTLTLVKLLEDEGADLVELGVPFSDPLADGPVIQEAASRALGRGVTLRKVISTVRMIRRSSNIPIILMTYYNPVFRYGLRRFIEDASSSGVDGLIVPDLPPDEAAELLKESRRQDISTIFLLAPTSTDKRIRLVSRASTGFIYYVSITGITGSRLRIDRHLVRMVRRIKNFSNKPVCVGFGVKKPEEAAAVANCSDGVIVGSSIVKMIKEKRGSLRKYIRDIRKAIDGLV
ncbi:MAG TPA: tryptophan synthase subunit alpha [Nitrospirae bacterium]|nr:tryptophan synthase subunit alpha [Nitrospirota bacterium]